MCRVILCHQRDRHPRTQLVAYPLNRLTHTADIVRQHEQPHDQPALQQTILVKHELIARLPEHLTQRRARHVFVPAHLRIEITRLVVGVLQIRQINIDYTIEQTQYTHRVVSVRVIDHGHAQSLLRGEHDRARHLRREVGWGNEVDVVTTARLQFQKHFGETLVRDFVFYLLFVSLRNLVVLTIHTTQVAIAEEDVAGAFRANERRLLAAGPGVRRHDRQQTRRAPRDLVVETIIQTVAGANRATLQKLFELGNAGFEQPLVQQRALRWFDNITHDD